MLGKALTTAAAGNAAGEATYVEDVFSTYLYDAQPSSFSIDNGIALGDTFYDAATSSNTTASSLRSGVSIGDFFVESSGGVTYGIFNNYQAGEFLQVQYNQDVKVTQVTYRNEVGTNWAPTSVLIQSSSDGVSWNTELTYSDNNTTNQQVLTITSGTSATYWRMYQNSDTRGGSAGYEWHITQFSMTGSYDVAGFGEGGLVWIKKRSGTNNRNHIVFDSERGPDSSLYVNTTDAPFSMSGLGFTSTVFNSNGFTTGDSSLTNENNGSKYASWTFRKAPKFFDIVTYTGDGVQGKRVSHNLGCEPSMIITKCISPGITENWNVTVGSGAGIPDQIKLQLNSTGFSTSTYSYWGSPAGDATTEFGLYRGTPTFGETNVSGREYIAYLFAHNDGDGEFGENADQDIIKGGNYTGNGGTQDIDVGFEPQWLLIKNATTTSQWSIVDVMRGFVTSSSVDSVNLEPNNTDSEANVGRIGPTANGFRFISEANGELNANGNTFIYIAIRRGPMKTPESGTEVFATATRGDAGDSKSPGLRSGFPVDWLIWRADKNSSGDNTSYQRLTASNLYTHSTGIENVSSSFVPWFAYMDGWLTSTTTDVNDLAWMFRRAPGFFDVVAYTGNGTAGRTVSHNLGVAPEMIIVKKRNSSTNSHWTVYNPLTISSNNVLYLHLSDALQSNAGVLFGNGTTAVAPTETDFTLGAFSYTNGTSETYIAYLFATLPGVSKVGSYTGNGSSQTIDCGFSAGARFVLIKRTDSTSNWNVFDTERGIVAGNDPRLELNTRDAEDTGDDGVDPDSSGFVVNYVATNNDDVNVSGGTYIFLAIA